jgi:hypothetical protein
MQESVTAPPTKENLQESASALLEAIVRAEVELNALQERCGSLEIAISLGREAVATAESLPAESTPAKSTSGKGAQERSPASEEISPAPTTPAMAPIKPPKPLSVPKRQPAKAEQKDPKKASEPVLEPVLEPVAAAPASETPESRAAASASLEQQAAALRAAMGAQSAPAAEPPPANAATAPSLREPAKAEAPPTTPPEPVEHESGPFKPKRSTPLKSRLAGLDVKAAETESESYSERSAELEQLLRSRDEG